MCIAVEQNISLLIPDQWKLEKLHPLEIFALHEDVSTLKDMLNSEIMDVKITSIRTLARLIGEQFLPELDVMIKDKNRYVRIAVIHAFAEIVEASQKDQINNLCFFYQIRSLFNATR